MLCLIRQTAFVYLGLWATPNILAIWLMVGLWATQLSTGPVGDWRLKVNHKGSQPCLYDQAPVKTLEHPGEHPQLEILHACCHALLLGEFSAVHDSTRSWQLVAPMWRFPGLCPMHLFPLAAFKLCSFTIIKHNHQYNSFQWVLWVLLESYQTIWGWSWRSPNFNNCC